MRRFLIFLTFVCVAVSVPPLKAASIADSLAFQGRVTDASDNPLPDGPRDLTISLWSDSVGGTMLHSEIVVVTLSKGLYSTCIGCGSSSFFDIFADQSVYLQVQLAGSPPMTPRTPMRSVPFSVSSSSLHNQGTMPGGSVTSAAVSSVGNLAGGGGGAAAASYARLAADSDGDGHDDFVITDSARTDGAHSVMGGDLDGDGIQDVVIASIVRPTSASLAIKTKGTSAQRLRAGGDCDDADATLFTDCDDDGDGIAESSVSSSSSPEGASLSINSINNNMPNRISMNVTVPKQTQRCVISQGSDSNLDGIDETSMTSTVERKSGSIVYLDREGNEVLRSMVGVDSTRGVITTDRDSDGDGVPDGEATLTVIPGTSSVAIKTKGTGADANKTAACTAISSFPIAGRALAGLACTVDDDGDGIPESEISQLVTPTTSGVAIKVKGTGAEKNRTAGSSCDDSLAIDYLDIDDDGDGISEAHAVSSVSSLAAGGGGAAAASYAATGRWYADSDDDGVPEGDIEAKVTPTTNSVAIKTKGTGADANRVSITQTTDTTRALSVMAVDLDGDGLADRSVTMDCDDTDGGITVAGASSAVKIKHKGWDGLIYGRMAIETGGAIEVDFGGNGVGFVSQRFGIGVLSPTHPIEHSSGAHLTAGGVWTNASDENLKENFQSVDGAELLEKIEQLQISEWNYKNESDETKHIGPTAQDFQKVFGVGSDGKSISTIDPSGIALAAIKELNKKLEQENKALRIEMDELKKLVQQLAAQK